MLPGPEPEPILHTLCILYANTMWYLSLSVSWIIDTNKWWRQYLANQSQLTICDDYNNDKLSCMYS